MKHWFKQNRFYLECLLVIVLALLLILGVKWGHTKGHLECSYARVPSLCAADLEDEDG